METSQLQFVKSLILKDGFPILNLNDSLNCQFFGIKILDILADEEKLNFRFNPNSAGMAFLQKETLATCKTLYTINL